MKQTAHIENWRVMHYMDGHGECLIGNVSKHPKQNSFSAMTQQTSLLVSIDEERGIAETLNTVYTLGAKDNG